MSVHSNSFWSTPLLVLVMMTVALPALSAQTGQLPDPDGKPADSEKPVKVFILLGQSNMLGFGRIDPVEQNGTLSWLVKLKRSIRI